MASALHQYVVTFFFESKKCCVRYLKRAGSQMDFRGELSRVLDACEAVRGRLYRRRRNGTWSAEVALERTSGEHVDWDPPPPREEYERTVASIARASMSEICRFYGIIIRMYYNDHNPPHFHAEYQGNQAEYDINTLDIIAGGISKRAHALVLEWASLHKIELLSNWDKARVPSKIDNIEPLD